MAMMYKDCKETKDLRCNMESNVEVCGNTEREGQSYGMANHLCMA